MSKVFVKGTIESAINAARKKGLILTDVDEVDILLVSATVSVEDSSPNYKEEIVSWFQEIPRDANGLATLTGEFPDGSCVFYIL
jgi:hypothetical protein